MWQEPHPCADEPSPTGDSGGDESCIRPDVTNPTALVAVALLVGVVAGVWLPLPLAGVRVVIVVVWAMVVVDLSLRAGPVPVLLVAAS